MALPPAGDAEGGVQLEGVAGRSPAVGTRVRVLGAGRGGVLRAKREANTRRNRVAAVIADGSALTTGHSAQHMAEMIEAMEAKGCWTSPGGKTPHATLYSAILRDLAAADDAKFVKTESGRFAART